MTSLPQQTSYAQMSDNINKQSSPNLNLSTGHHDINLVLTPYEIDRIKTLIGTKNGVPDESTVSTLDSEYPGFGESTHSWAVFADHPKKSATLTDRLVGFLIIAFQLFTYFLFAKEAIVDYQSGQVPVTTGHGDCLQNNGEPEGNFECEAQFTSNMDAFVAFFMLGIFLTGDFIQAVKVLRIAPFGCPMFFACFAAIEVFSAYFAACIAISYNLFIGEVTDAVEVGVGLLFIRELSQRAYTGITSDGSKQHTVFFSVLALLVTVGMFMDPLCEYIFANKGEYGRNYF
mmetsp:Transcript_10230/g.11415  ORF Transcript_10230/g.11415 Transcript_10230/m.11415 type:complete len:287 (+) Transcript_10230:175-1035(+)|eukprot:CAMPEP_0194147092 /NCGR_PEP_ID=MMETSP0152-20130528/22516_1 /TAXON_ID=1049557 /ORGANISM="Thalassiothrix antarctica, Strain L6-D1" /LENGTH=286 /DNA_ID=CAMNT_0038847783 /DNA_START=175 /DNA_END=1035 /DNA_ORIENTATION=+